MPVCIILYILIRGFPSGPVVKNLLVNAGNARDMGSIPMSGRFLRVGNGNPCHILAWKIP